MPDRVICVVNTTSGAGLAEKVVGDLRRSLADEQAGFGSSLSLLRGSARWEMIYTDAQGEWCRRLVTEIGATSGKAWLVLVGGDGTFSQAVGAVAREAGAAGKCVFLFLPAGRGNDFVRGFSGYVGDGSDFIERTKNGDFRCEVSAMDWIAIGDRVCLNMASFGYGGRVVEKTSRGGGMFARTRLVYQVQGARSLLEERNLDAEIWGDGKLLMQGEFFGGFLGNGKANGNGLYWTRDAEVGDGKIDFVWFEKPSVLKMLGAIQAVKNREASGLSGGQWRGEELRIASRGRPVALEIDGDFAGESLEWRARVVSSPTSFVRYAGI